MLAAKRQMRQRAFRTGKIDENVKIIFYRRKAALNDHAGLFRPASSPAPAAQQGKAFALQRGAAEHLPSPWRHGLTAVPCGHQPGGGADL